MGKSGLQLGGSAELRVAKPHTGEEPGSQEPITMREGAGRSAPWWLWADAASSREELSFGLSCAFLEDRADALYGPGAAVSMSP